MRYNTKMVENDILTEENLELAALAGAAPVKLPKKIISLFPAFAHRNFQLYTFGQIISLVGFWLQQVGIGYYVFHLTHSEFWVGTAAAIAGLPFLLFTSFAGVAIDRLDKQKILLYTQATEAFVDIALGILILTNHATLPIVLLAIFIVGVINAIDLPTRLTFLIEMVGKKDLASAVPINNGLFNAARFVGPAIAGILIATTSVGWTFVLNGISFIAGMWAVLQIKPIYKYEVEIDVHPLRSLKDGVKFAFTHSKIFYFILLAFTTAIFIWPFQTLMPPIAENVFHSGAKGLGTLLSAAGAGSLSGAIFTSANSRRSDKIIFIIIGGLISSIALILFAINRNFLLAHMLLFFVGFGTLTMVSTLNTLVQMYSPDHMRARINAVYITMFVGMMPLGNAIAGVVAEHISAMNTLKFEAIIFLAISVVLYAKGVFTNLSQEN